MVVGFENGTTGQVRCTLYIIHGGEMSFDFLVVSVILDDKLFWYF